tara:strand:+ start:7947 stop:8522 length:576 start_codon:yes stop_codon:yes gene_type:complete
MAYDNNIPVSGNTLGGTRQQINSNFADIDTHFQVNHVDFETSGAGKHTFLQMPEQSSAPTTAANEGGVYTKEADSESCLFYRREGDGAELQLTTAASTVNATEGMSFLPGGLLMKWGIVATPGASGTVTFSVAAGFTAFSAAPYSITLTGNHATTGTAYATTGTPIATEFLYRTSTTQNADNLYWTAIGPV